MIHLSRIALFITVFCAVFQLQANEAFRNQLFDPTFKTLTVHPTSQPLSFPLIDLKKGTLDIAFDVMSHQPLRMAYRLIYCNADWTKSDVFESEYMNGMIENDFPDGMYSGATYVHYTHYRLRLPNENIQLKLSGNYALLVYNKDQPEQVYLTACFMVCEPMSSIEPTITADTDLGYKSSFQQLQFRVKPYGFSMMVPDKELKVQVLKNFGFDGKVLAVKPSGNDGSSYFFEHLKALVFKGGNEYRRFETTSSRFSGLNTTKTRVENNAVYTDIQVDNQRNTLYQFDQDQNGKFLVRTVDCQYDGNTCGEYFWVNFTFKPDGMLQNSRMYICGDLTTGMKKEDCEMTFDPNSKQFRKTLLLKQGSYNYRYSAESKDGLQDISEYAEGSYWQTENVYQILVYHRKFGEYADRLVGFREIKSLF